MEREANLLRCSKLSCYAEFNRMVHAISRNVGEPGLQHTSHRMSSGSSAEYLFYTTLSSMLGQIVHSSDPASQERELQQVYQWFCTNKPLISAKTWNKHQKPKLSLSGKTPAAIGRPHTAPASFNLPPSSSSGHTYHNHTFTSSYMSQSLSLDLTKSFHCQTRPTNSPLCSRRSQRPVSVGGQQSVCVSVVELVCERESVSGGTLLQLAPVVAARMQLERELRADQVRVPTATVPPDNSRSTPARPPGTPSGVTSPHKSPSPHSDTVDNPLSIHSTSLHVMELDLPPPTVPTHTRGPPSALKRKAASGFNCSRYRPHRAS